eukprot:UN00233
MVKVLCPNYLLYSHRITIMVRYFYFLRPTTLDAAQRLIATLSDLKRRQEEERLANEIELFKYDDASVEQLFCDMAASTDNPDELANINNTFKSATNVFLRMCCINCIINI